jgi:hypothetical protein
VKRWIAEGTGEKNRKKNSRLLETSKTVDYNSGMITIVELAEYNKKPEKLLNRGNRTSQFMISQDR